MERNLANQLTEHGAKRTNKDDCNVQHDTAHGYIL